MRRKRRSCGQNDELHRRQTHGSDFNAVIKGSGKNTAVQLCFPVTSVWRTERQTGRQTDRQGDRQAERWTDTQMTDRQTDTACLLSFSRLQFRSFQLCVLKSGLHVTVLQYELTTYCGRVPNHIVCVCDAENRIWNGWLNHCSLPLLLSFNTVCVCVSVCMSLCV